MFSLTNIDFKVWAIFAFMNEELPLVSILIPARNEAENLPILFASLEKLKYPHKNLEILLGNDDSADQTGEMMDDFALNKSWVKVFHLDGNNQGILKGKTRVLVVLATQASGKYLFFTDADVSLPENWISGMLKYFTSGVGVVVGVTGFQRKSLFSALQGIEWLMALSMFKIAADRGVSSTGLGNNMAVSKDAYRAIGGYQRIGFSIVEDFLLYQKIIDAGFGFSHAFNHEVMAYTVPPENYFEQRKRWIKGAMESKPLAMSAGILQALFIPVMIVLGFFSLKISLYSIMILISVYAGLIIFFERKLKIKGYLKYLPLFSVYISTAWFLQFIYFLFKKETVWKGRSY